MPTPDNNIVLRHKFKLDFNRTNAPGTCLWCGKKLNAYRHGGEDDTKRGDYGDNAFCGLRCGYSFGVIMAKDGHRMKPYSGSL